MSAPRHNKIFADINEEIENTSIQSLGDNVSFGKTDVTVENEILPLIAHAQSLQVLVGIQVNNAWSVGDMGRIAERAVKQ